VLLHDDDHPLHAAFADPTLAQSATTALAGRREDALPVG
jgi:hypothetical protein